MRIEQFIIKNLLTKIMPLDVKRGISYVLETDSFLNCLKDFAEAFDNARGAFPIELRKI
jgi:hypothetical protein